MTDFPTQPVEVMGGNRFTFRFIAVTDVASMPYIYKGKTAAEPVLHAGKSWFNGNSIMDQLVFEEPSAIDAPGEKYEPRLSGKVLYSSNALGLFAELSRARYIVIFTDNDGIPKLGGSIKNGMRFRFQQMKGAAPADPKVLEFEFYTTSTTPCPDIVVS